MVLFVGDVASDTRDREAFQEVDFCAFFGPSTKGMAKRVERIDDAKRIPEYVARAFATAMNGRPGPVVLVLPEDMLTHEVTQRPLPKLEPVEAWSDPGSLRQLREMLLSAQKPFVIAGGGAWTTQSAQALQRFAENWQLPVAIHCLKCPNPSKSWCISMPVQKSSIGCTTPIWPFAPP